MRKLQRGNVARVVQVVLALGAAFAFYHFYYLDQRRETLHERNLRELASVAHQLEESLVTWNEVVANFIRNDPTLGFPVPGPLPADDRDSDASDLGWEVARGQLQGARARVLPQPPPDREPAWIDVRPRGRVTWVSFTQRHRQRWVEVHLRLRRVVDRIDLPERMFDQLLLLDHQGRVLLRRGNAAVRVTGFSLGDPAPNHAHRSRQSLGGDDWEVFAQPVLLAPSHAPPGASVEPLTWHLVGLVDSPSLEAESAALPPPVLVMLVCALFLLALLLPILKTTLLARHERVHRRDLLTLAVASAAAMALLAILVADLYALGSLEAALDRGLQSLAVEMADDVRSELDAMKAQLDELLAAGLGAEEGVRAGLLSQPPEGLPDARQWPYPWFEVAAWIDPDGWQRSRWTVAEDASGRISVADRAYFRRVLEGNTWALDEAGREPVALEPIQSLLTGHRLAVLSMPVMAAAEERDDGSGVQDGETERLRGVAALAAQPLTLMEPVLPVDVGFAVVEPDGRVLFHSDPARNGRADWLAGCGHDPRMTQAIQNRERTLLDVQYQGRPIRAHVEPLGLLPLSLVVFHDREPLQRLHLDLLLWVLASALTLLALLTLGAVALATVWFFARGRREWLLGSGERFENADLRLLWVLSLIALTLACQLADSGLTSKLTFALVLPAVAVFFFLARLAWKRSRTRRPWLEVLPVTLWLVVILVDLFLVGLGRSGVGSWLVVLATGTLWLVAARLWMRNDDPADPLSSRFAGWIRDGGGVVINSFLFFLVVAALPTGLVFQVLWQAEQWTLVSRQQRWLALQLEARHERLHQDFSRPHRVLPRAGSTGLLEDRLAFPAGDRPWDRREPPFDPASAGSGEPSGETVAPTSSIFAVHVEVVDTCPFQSRDPAAYRAGDARDPGQWLWNHLQGLHARLPLRQARSLDGQDTDAGWGGFRRADLTAEGHVRLHVASPRGGGCLHLVSPGTPPRHLAQGLPWLVVLVGIGYLGAIGFATRRLLTFDLNVDRGVAEQPPGEDWLLWIGSPRAARRTFPATADQPHLDLSSATGRERLEINATGPTTPDHPEASPAEDGDSPSLAAARRLVLLEVDSMLHDARSLGRLLSFLEHLLDHQAPPSVVLVLSAPLEVDTLRSRLESPTGSAAAAQTSDDPWSANRILDALGGFVVYSTDRLGAPLALPTGPLTPDSTDVPARAAATLLEEAGDNTHLRRIAAWLLAAPGFARRPLRQRLDDFREAADLYYRWLWSRTQGEERRVLFQLAEEDLVNPAAQDTAQRLVRRGLAHYVAFRGLRSLNGSFREWVRQRAEVEDLARLERGPGGWAQVRHPLAVALLAVLVFLLSTQKDLLGDTLGDLHKTLVQAVAVITAAVSAIAGLGQFLPLGKGSVTPDGS